MAKLVAKHPCGVGKTFFQSLVPYLQNSFLSLSVVQVLGQWFQDEPHPSSRRFLTGHYGIYFGLFSQELRKEEKRPRTHEQAGFLVVYRAESVPSTAPEFFISQANQKIHFDIQTLRTVTQDLLSTLAVVKPKCSLKQLCQTRNFSTASHRRRHNIDKTIFVSDHIQEIKAPAEQIDQAQELETKSLAEESVAKQDHQTIEADEENFEESFLASQMERIESIFHNHIDIYELNTIYPIYQSLQRNDIDLPSVDAYNMVLKSICFRLLDNEGTLESIECKLTSLLTVYQDLLSAHARNEALLPNSETYNTILPSIFRGAIQTVYLSSDLSVTSHKASVAYNKAADYAKVGLDLFLSIKNKRELDIARVLTPLFTCLQTFPHLITPELASLVVSYSSTKAEDYEFYINLISLSKNFTKLETLGLTKKELYTLVSSVYTNYKEQVQVNGMLGRGEFQVYSAMIETLLASGNVPVATRFLDCILSDFKEQLLVGKSAHMKDVSSLLLTYLESLMGTGRSEDLMRSFSLLQKFRAVSYLPEPSVTVYNDMINKFISLYTQQEFEKTQGHDDVAEKQVEVYNNIWHLYNYAVIRKDFQSFAKTSSLTKTVSCRDSLLSLSLDLGDHSNIARLIKEVLLKDHLIADWNVSKKLCQYLYNGVIAHGNAYYQNLLWSVVEQQAKHFEKDSAELNAFLSEHVSFLLINSPLTFTYVVNLMMIFGAFDKFKLLTDNAFGLMSVSSFLIAESQRRHLNSTETIKILQYQACLINEFEDPDNHYTELCPELQALKIQTSRAFVDLFSGLQSGSKLTRDILQACSMLGLDSASNEAGLIKTSNYELDLSTQLNLNKEAGTEVFATYFQQGYSFTTETWAALMTQNFAMDVLDKESSFSVAEFIDRLCLNKDAEVHLQRLICLYNDKVTIKTVQALLKSEKFEILGSSNILEAISAHASLTDNKYFLKTLALNCAHLFSLNNNPNWIVKLFNKFNQTGMSSTVCEFADRHEAELSALDISDESSAAFISAITDAYLNTNQMERCSIMFKNIFSGVEKNKLLLESDKLLGCLLNYYIASGAYNTVLKKFGVMKGRSGELDHIIQFSQFLNSLEGKPATEAAPKSIKTEQGLALTILAECDLVKMKIIFETNHHLISNKNDFFDLLITTLTKAASLVGAPHYERVLSRFEAVVKLCKVFNLKELPAKSLTKIIRFLAATKAGALLNIVFNKFIINNTIVPTFNFYFLKVTISSTHETRQLILEFGSALRLVGDVFNLRTIEAFESKAN